MGVGGGGVGHICVLGRSEHNAGGIPRNESQDLDLSDRPGHRGCVSVCACWYEFFSPIEIVSVLHYASQSTENKAIFVSLAALF